MRPIMPVKNPRTGLPDHEITPLDAFQLGQITGRLRAAQPGWAARPLAERLDILGAFSESLASHASAICAALTRDTGRRHISSMELQGVRAMLSRWQKDDANLDP